MVRIQTLERLFEAREKHHADEIVLTGAYEDPQGYGRIIRDHKGEAVDIIEEKDATADQKEIREVNTGIACFKIDTLLQGLSHLSRDNAAGEYYLTDLVRIFCAWDTPSGHSKVPTRMKPWESIASRNWRRLRKR